MAGASLLPMKVKDKTAIESGVEPGPAGPNPSPLFTELLLHSTENAETSGVLLREFLLMEAQVVTDIRFLCRLI